MAVPRRDPPTFLSDCALASLALFEDSVSSSSLAAWCAEPIAAQGGGITVRVRSSSEEGRPSTFYTSASLTDVTVQQINESMLYENRLRWDAQILEPVYLARFTTMDVVAYRSASAMAGLIAGRSFVDVRYTTTSEDGESQIMSSSCSAPVETTEREAACGATEWLRRADDELHLVRATNFSGGGIAIRRRVSEVEGRGERVVVDVDMMSTTALGGKLPAWMIKSATAAAMKQLLGNMAKHNAFTILPEGRPTISLP